MRKVCEVYLVSSASSDERGVELTFPVSRYEMMDAFEQIHTKSPGDVYWQVDEFYCFDYLAPHLDESMSIFEFNSLTEQLSKLDERQETALEGLLQMQVNKHMQENSGIITVPELMMLASNVDRCQVLADVNTDEALGKFYVENGFREDLDALPDSVYDLLDYAKIGKQMSEDESGVFTPHGYVVRTEELEPLPEHEPQREISYMIRLTLMNHENEQKTAVLDLPATQERMMEVQEELDELKQEKRNVKRQIQLADDIIKEDLYTAYYAVTGKEEIVADRDVEIPGMEDDTEVEKATATVVEPDRNVEVMNPNNIQNEIGRQKEQTDSARKQQTDLDGIGKTEIHNSSDVNVARMDKSMTDVTDKGEYVETKENEPVDKVSWIVRRISELGGYENVDDSAKVDVFGFDIADVSGSIRLFSDVMKRLDIKLDGDELYEEFQRIYDERVSRDTNTEKAKDKIWDMRR